MYEAELAVCAGNMDGAVSALHAYAAEHRRQYPYRGAVRLGGNTQQHILSHGDDPDRDLRRVSEEDEAKIRAGIDSCHREIQKLFKKMDKTEAKIKQLGAETRAILDKLKAA